MGPDYDSYAAKMRAQTLDGTDLEVVARFTDMLSRRCRTCVASGGQALKASHRFDLPGGQNAES